LFSAATMLRLRDDLVQVLKIMTQKSNTQLSELVLSSAGNLDEKLAQAFVE